MAATDTSAAADATQLRLLASCSPSRRAAMMRSLSSNVVALSRRAVRQQMPTASEPEVLLRWVELNYGHALARGLRAHLERRR